MLQILPPLLALYIHSRTLGISMAKQVHAAWTEMSETLWKRDQYQLTSAGILLNEYSVDVDMFEIPVAEGVEQLCWGIKKVVSRLKGKVVEVAIDVTCECTCFMVIIN